MEFVTTNQKTGCLHDPLLCLSHDQAVQKLHHADEGTAENQQRQDQPNDATYVTTATTVVESVSKNRGFNMFEHNPKMMMSFLFAKAS